MIKIISEKHLSVGTGMKKMILIALLAFNVSAMNQITSIEDHFEPQLFS